MKTYKIYLYGTLLSLPFMALWFYLCFPPECPLNYTQEQIDASRCVVGANIGGPPLFIGAVIGTWFLTVWLVRKYDEWKSQRK